MGKKKGKRMTSPEDEKVAYRFEVRYLEPTIQGLSREEVMDYLNTPGNVVGIRAGELLGRAVLFCVDGREDGAIVGTPGGDVSLLTEAIIAIGNETDKKLEVNEISNVFNWYLDTFGSFYMHTDTHGLEHLMGMLNKDKRVEKKIETVKEMEAELRKPQNIDKELLLELLVNPKNVGCGHLRLMLEDAAGYHVSQKVIERIIESYFKTLWRNDEQSEKLVFRVLEGNHEERAVVVIKVPGDISEDTIIPMVRPSNGDLSMFVAHPQVVSWMHKNVAFELAKSGIFEEVTEQDAEKIAESMDRLGGEELRQTTSHLASGLPIHEIEAVLVS